MFATTSPDASGRQSLAPGERAILPLPLGGIEVRMLSIRAQPGDRSLSISARARCQNPER